ncbi:radical S-adenosyl methionine domain-containing protein 1, mitochondrial [Pogoniulus pusillus]|uniref:radical S-adenosyl methionine domain-containing protein 1, mitochondrial n=1 Tax=Pogoniulus pusillus TaxID=488313 RepID=UPI0030B947A2
MRFGGRAPAGLMAARRWRPAATAAIAAARPGGGGPGRALSSGTASEPALVPVTEAVAPATAALYVHWPYCRKRCSYCSFNKYVVPAVDEAAMGTCLVREARTLLRLSQVQSVSSVFFGGGTPSLASPRTIAAVLEAVAGAAHLPAGTEVTLEANPSSAGTQRLADFKAAGVNRLSIGIQSLNDAELRLLGREHTAAEARGTIEVARRLFPGRTSLDLIFGLPRQSREAWAQGLEAALGLCDDHISLYQLTLERGTLLAAQVWGGALPAPPQDLLADMYLTAHAVLVAAGFRHYEVSNFARKGALSTHNLSYWRAEQYIGVGPGKSGLEEVLALGLRTDEGITHERRALHRGEGLALLDSLPARPALPAAALLGPAGAPHLRNCACCDSEALRQRDALLWPPLAPLRCAEGPRAAPALQVEPQEQKGLRACWRFKPPESPVGCPSLAAHAGALRTRRPGAAAALRWRAGAVAVAAALGAGALAPG